MKTHRDDGPGFLLPPIVKHSLRGRMRCPRFIARYNSAILEVIAVVYRRFPQQLSVD
jgi:hypothetical protein